MFRIAASILFFAMTAVSVHAQAIFPPTVTKSFTPSTVVAGQQSTLTIRITNPNNTNLTGASLNDFMPAPLTATGAAATTCPSGSAFATPTLVTLAAATIPANGSCTVTATVFSPTPAVIQNSTGNVFSSGPSSLSGGSATLTVTAPVPVGSKAAMAALALLLSAIGAAAVGRG